MLAPAARRPARRARLGQDRPPAGSRKRTRQDRAGGGSHGMNTDPARLAGYARVHRLRIDDVQSVWREWGAGAPVVLVHGGTGSWLHWVRNISGLAASYRVLVPDMAGFGDSSNAPPGLGATGQARLLLAGLRELLDAATPVAFVGFSFGAIVGGLAAAQADRPVRGLMLVGAVGLGIDRGPPLPMRAWKHLVGEPFAVDRKSTRLNSSHVKISYAVFCLKKKK